MKIQFPTKPRLKQSFTTVVLEPDVLLVMGEYRQYIFQGKTFVLIHPLLDGAHTIPEILGRVGAEVTLPDMYSALFQLLQKECLAEASEKPLLEYTAFWDQLNADTAQVAARLDELEISVAALGNLDAEILVDPLRRNGLKVTKNGPFLVLLTEDYLQPELVEINRERLATGLPWLLVKPRGMMIWVGPLFRPGATACWKCLEQRLSANRQVETYIRNPPPEPVVFNRSRSAVPVSLAAAMNLAAMEVIRFVADRKGVALENKVTTLDLASLEWKEHVLVRRPQCSACGTGTIEPEPLVLESRLKTVGHRTLTPEETFERYKHHISPVTGAVTSLLTREDSPFGRSYSAVAGHYFPIIKDDIRLLRVCLYARSGGKGDTLIQAKTSALCESLERYSGIAWGEEKKVFGTYRELASDAIHIRDLTLFSEAQYRNREAWNLACQTAQEFVPDPLADDARIAWTPAWSLSNKCFRYLPTAFCYYGHQDFERPFSLSDSNGNAAGNVLEEAILQGFLELVERDAVALWWYNRLRLQAVDVDSFHLPYWVEMKTLYHEKLKRDLHVIDLTADLKIPVFVAISRNLMGPTEDIIVSPGAHLDPETAMVRALVEANQYLPALVHEPGTFMPEYAQQLSDPKMVAWWKTATYENQPYLLPDPLKPARKRDDYPALSSTDLREDVRTCVRIARERGMEVLVVNQTRLDIGLPVVKVVVPGLRHFWRRLAPGRLFDVPVALGRLDRPLAEEELNPIACFI